MRQRLFNTGLLVHKPDVLIMDEPLARWMRTEPLAIRDLRETIYPLF
jgi:ABC-type multidrug transport system ATPase subunit